MRLDIDIDAATQRYREASEWAQRQYGESLALHKAQTGKTLRVLAAETGYSRQHIHQLIRKAKTPA